MYVSNQVIDFIEFVLIGVLIASIFDFFRAYRKIKKVSTLTVMIQDSIYFIIVTMVIIFSIIKLLDSQIRLYVFLGILLPDTGFWQLLFRRYAFLLQSLLPLILFFYLK